MQPLEASSFDAWIKFYRRDENTPNTGTSYYVKGAVVAFLLDAKIRKATGGKKSLDDVMRLAYDALFGADAASRPSSSAPSPQEVAGIDLSAWFRKALETTEELDYAEMLDWFGLRFGKDEKKNGNGNKPPKAWLGLVAKNEDGRLMVNQVKRGTPGYEAGFNVGDEILAIGDDRIPPDQWSKRMEFFRPGDKVSVLISRRDRLRRIDADLRPGAAPASGPWRSTPRRRPSRRAIARRGSASERDGRDQAADPELATDKHRWTRAKRNDAAGAGTLEPTVRSASRRPGRP